MKLQQNILKTLFVLLAALLVCPLSGKAQTMRGDFNMDGNVGMDDLTAMINALLTDSYGEPRPEDRDTITVNGVSFVMVRVEGGTYSSDALDNCIHNVETFSIGLTEVTVAQWLTVMDSLPSGNGSGPSQLPLVTVSWNLCQEFISRLNAVTGLNFRMPTQVEWEYAATGGKFTHGYPYAGSDNLAEVGWYKDHTGNMIISNVGMLKPNELGLYDMSGNASEWCQDVIEIHNGKPWYGLRGGDAKKTEKACQTTAYPKTSTTDYSGTCNHIATGDERVFLSGLRLAL